MRGFRGGASGRASARTALAGTRLVASLESMAAAL
jgi:hypothetical protein